LESQPNPENCSLEELKKAIESSPTQRGFMRLTAIHALLMGVERSVVCAMFFRSDRVVRLWIEMFNRISRNSIPGNYLRECPTQTLANPRELSL
jgi:hypothetical protein